MNISDELRLGATVLREGDHAPMHVMMEVAQILASNGEVCVCFDERSRDLTVAYDRLKAITTVVQGIVSDATYANSDWVLPKSGPIRLFGLYQTGTIRFTDAPWHPANCKGGKEHHRLIEMVEKGKPFTAVYEFDDQPNHREDGTGMLGRVLSNVVDDAELSVIRRDWPYDMFKGKSRVDIRIVPKAKVIVPPLTPETSVWWENLEPQGKRIVLMQDGSNGVVSASPDEVKRVLTTFVIDGEVSAIFSASIRDADEAYQLGNFSSPASLISDWLKEHGVDRHDVTVMSCHKETPHVFRVKFHRSKIDRQLV